MRVLCVAGARPNFVKLGPLWQALSASAGIEPQFVHTGQHYDDVMSAVFLRQLGLPAPLYMLGVGSGSHAMQTAAILSAFEPVLAHAQPHVVLVVGDVNSTVACALAAAKFELADAFMWQGTRRQRPVVAHVEAGLRSGDRNMPEEINRLATDAIADVLFTTEASANEHLAREGVPAANIEFVGNVMIDALLRVPVALSELAPATPYAVVTLHRPSNVDSAATLLPLLHAIEAAAPTLALIFPVHPRTKAKLEPLRSQLRGNWQFIEPLGYIEFVQLVRGAQLVCTDSGGLQEETTILGVPCVTLRDNTERPITITHGTNQLAGSSPAAVAATIRTTLAAPRPTLPPPPLWDGHAAERIVAALLRRFG